MEQTESSKEAALSRVLKVVASRSGQAVMYTTALLGTAALVPGVQLEGLAGALAAGVGLEAIGSQGPRNDSSKPRSHFSQPKAVPSHSAKGFQLAVVGDAEPINSNQSKRS